MANFSLVDQLGHRSDRFFNRCVRVDTMLVIEIDGFNVEASQTCFAGGANIFRSTVDSDKLALGITNITEFRGKDHLITSSFDSPSDQLFIRERPVNVSSVEKVDAQLQCAMNRGNGFLVIAVSVEVRHPHAAQSHSGNLESLT